MRQGGAEQQGCSDQPRGRVPKQSGARLRAHAHRHLEPQPPQPPPPPPLAVDHQRHRRAARHRDARGAHQHARAVPAMYGHGRVDKTRRRCQRVCMAKTRDRACRLGRPLAGWPRPLGGVGPLLCECIGQPQAFGCGQRSPWWPAVAPTAKTATTLTIPPHASSDSAVSTGHVPRISRQLVRWPAAPPLKTHADAAAPAASAYAHHEQLESRRHTCMVKRSGNGAIGGLWQKGRGRPVGSEAKGPSSRVRRAASSLQMQPHEPLVASGGATKTPP